MKINELKIYSKDVNSQATFYTEVLGIECIEQLKERVSLKIGNSVLTIEHRDQSTPYHFAINIPSNKEEEALKWLKDRVTVLSENQTELHNFDFWNAKAIYFYDCDKNIVEFIARKNLKIQRDPLFDINQLICISEIGMPTLNIESKFNALETLANLQIFGGNYERMLAIGDEMGLFICINKEIKKWFPINDEAYSSDFELDFSQDVNTYRIKFEDDKIVKIT